MMNFKCKILNSGNKNLIYGAAECLSKTFTGIQVGKYFISEPLSQICKLSKDDMMEFTLDYIKNIVSDGLCIIALDNDTGKVIGAMAAENYDPNRNSFTFNGNSKSIYNIFNFLADLDEIFLSNLESKIGRKVVKNEYVHGTMLGVITESNKKYIANEMLELLIDEASKQGYKAMFSEATNFKSQKFSELYGFYVAKDLKGNPISKKYCEDKIFYQIPADVGSECLLMIKPIQEKLKIFY